MTTLSNNNATVHTSLLDQAVETVRELGLVGEDRAVRLLYLAMTTRVFDRIVSVAVKGPSSGGKSFLVDTVLRLFPDSAYHAVTAMSAKALLYSEERLQHRFLVVYEADGMGNGTAAHLIRTFQSEGRLSYETVDSSKDSGPRGRHIEREGPVGLIVTTTREQLHPENETRLLSLSVSDSPDQTRAVMLAACEGESARAPDLTPWHQRQRELESEGWSVTIPFDHDLARAIPPVAIRMRRDFRTVLQLIRAHALLHRDSRDEDQYGRVIADPIADYGPVRELVADLLSEGAGKSVSRETRETVAAVERLQAAEGVPQSELVTELRLDQATVSRRVNKAVTGGFLRKEKDGRTNRVWTAAPLPNDLELLPPPDALIEASWEEVL